MLAGFTLASLITIRRLSVGLRFPRAKLQPRLPGAAPDLLDVRACSSSDRAGPSGLPFAEDIVLSLATRLPFEPTRDPFSVLGAQSLSDLAVQSSLFHLQMHQGD